MHKNISIDWEINNWEINYRRFLDTSKKEPIIVEELGIFDSEDTYYGVLIDMKSFLEIYKRYNECFEIHG